MKDWECPLERRDDVWVCPLCGFSHRVFVRRNCPKRAPAYAFVTPTPVPPVDAAARQPKPVAVEEMPSTEEMLDDRYEIGFAVVEIEQAERRLAVCRNKCGEHFRDETNRDRCKLCRDCEGNAALAFVKRLTGEMKPVAECPWANGDANAH